MQITRSKVAWRGAIITRSSPLSLQNWLAVVRPGLIIPYAPNQTSRMKVPVDPLLPRPRFQLSLQRWDESQLIIALITSAVYPVHRDRWRVPRNTRSPFPRPFSSRGDFESTPPPPPPSPLPCTRVITVRSTSSACNSRPSFPAFLLVTPAKFGRQETRRTEDVHAWNSFLIGGNRRVKTFLSSPIDRSIQYEIEFERDGKAFELLSNRHQSERSANPFNKFSSTFPRGLTERNEIEIEKEGRGAYKYWPPRN